MTLEEAMAVRITADRVEAIRAVAELQAEVLRLRAETVSRNAFNNIAKALYAANVERDALAITVVKVGEAFAYRAPETFSGSELRALDAVRDYMLARREAEERMTGDIKRTDRDGEVAVQRSGDLRDTIHVRVVDNGESRWLEMSEWNARRVLVTLAMMLDLPLTKTALKQVKL